MSEIDITLLPWHEAMKLLPAKHVRFCEEYVKDFSKTRAAIRAGYSPKTAGQIGFQLFKKLENSIKKLIDEKTVSDGELLKMVSDISKSSVNEFIKVKKSTRLIDIEYSLIVKIMQIEKELQIKIAIFQNLLSKGLTYEDEAETHDAEVSAIQRSITAMETRLMLDPKATYTDKITEEYERWEFDLLAMSKDKELGRIASLQMTEFGPKVTMNSANDMLKLLAQIKGMTITKVDAKIESQNLNANVSFSPGEAKEIWDEIRKDF